MGYHRAGFEVVGVDIEPQPNYPFEFHRADALAFLAEHGSDFDAIHASPPCRDHTPLTSVAGVDGSKWLLDATLKRLADSAVPWIVENVMAAKMRADVVLCGGMFGLRTYRHRKFAVDPRIPLTLPVHPKHVALTATKQRKRRWEEGWHVSITGDVGTYLGPEAMGIDWMTGNELSQAIPPAYTQFLGSQLMDYCTADRRTA